MSPPSSPQQSPRTPNMADGDNLDECARVSERLRSVPRWSNLLSPSPSPRALHHKEDERPTSPIAAHPTCQELSIRPLSPKNVRLPLIYWSPTPAPRLDTDPLQELQPEDHSPLLEAHASNPNFTLRSPPPPKRLSVSYNRDSWYPTPITVTERMRRAVPGEDVPSSLIEHNLYAPPRQRPPQSIYASPPNHPASHAQAHFQAYGAMRPRLQIDPYPPPVDPRYFPAGGLERPRFPQVAHGMLRMERKRSFGSPGSTASPEFKQPRKRADDLQLNVLNEVFGRTSYPTTEEREELARSLAMTSRSVQIWFQNRRRAVKVEQQSAIQRAEAESRGGAIELRGRGPPGPRPMYSSEMYSGAARPWGGSFARGGPVGPMGPGLLRGIKREVRSPPIGMSGGRGD